MDTNSKDLSKHNNDKDNNLLGLLLVLLRGWKIIALFAILGLIIVLPFSFFLLYGKGSNEDSIDVELYPIEDVSVFPLDTISDKSYLIPQNQDNEDEDF